MPTMGQVVDALAGIFKTTPTASDVHSDAPPSGDKKRKKRPPDEHDCEMKKVDAVERMVYGWASVLMSKGEEVVDLQGDVVEPAEMARAATDFMKSARLAKAMHQGDGIGQVVHSFPITRELCEKLGIQSDNEGWIVGVHVTSDEVWDRVVKGELRSFSIGGRGARTEIAA